MVPTGWRGIAAESGGGGNGFALAPAAVPVVLVAAALAGLVLRVRRAGGAASRVERRGRRGLARDRGSAAQANDEGKHADGCGQRPARTREAPRLTLFPPGLRPSSLLDAVEVEGARRGALGPSATQRSARAPRAGR